MKQTTVEAIGKSVENIIKNNQDEITHNLLAGANESMSMETVTAIMVRNCLAQSIKLSVQMVLKILQDSGVLELDERQIAKILLKQLSSEIED